MESITSIPVRRTTRSLISEVNFDKLEFGKYVSDHMLVCDYSEGEWHTPHIVPFANLSLSPTSLALHYGQTVFEGMKAFRMNDGNINVFRISRHYERLVKSLERMSMAVIPKEIFIEGIIKLIEVDKAWVPRRAGDALYIRPFMYASEAKFGIKISEEYRFVIFTGPVPTLYSKPISVKVETEYIRAAKGGTGYAKCGGNYGGALYPTQLARQQGYDQLLWTDAHSNKYIEESGMMNIMFVIDNTIITPPVSDSILDGVTRDSLLAIADDMGFKIEERPISIHELEKAFRDHTITEAFGVGTAAVVAPIGLIHIEGIDFTLPAYDQASIHSKLKTQIDLLRTGELPDVWNWNHIV